MGYRSLSENPLREDRRPDFKKLVSFLHFALAFPPSTGLSCAVDVSTGLHMDFLCPVSIICNLFATDAGLRDDLTGKRCLALKVLIAV